MPRLAVSHDHGRSAVLDDGQELLGNLPVFLHGALQHRAIQGPDAGRIEKNRLVPHAHSPQGPKTLLLPFPIIGV